MSALCLKSLHMPYTLSHQSSTLLPTQKAGAAGGRLEWVKELTVF